MHGNQLEQLRSAVLGWLRTNPLAPLEQEIFLVQSNGVAEWLKIALAQELGVCAATRVTLPGRFLWEAYRSMLGFEKVPRHSALDKWALTWRLMHLLPTLLCQDEFAALRHFLADGDPERRLQLAQRLADLMDEYQVYRADWLEDWAAGHDTLRGPSGASVTLAPDQRWQARLWREVLASISAEMRGHGRADVHKQFLEAACSDASPEKPLPRRIVVFGLSALPYQTLEALGALATRMQVVIAVPNPCRYYWGDIIQGRDLLNASRRRQEPRRGRDLREVPFEELHIHSHPLLAGWGRMGRDFIRMLDEFDDVQACKKTFSNLRIDLFSEDARTDLLGQVQGAIRDLLPLDEHPRLAVDLEDRSIEFHVAHSVQREVEVLHDQLLAMFADASTSADPLKPRDVVVMVPDIEVFSPAIRAVFGQHGRKDERHIPFEIADITERRINPLLVALDWLMRLPHQRCLQSEVRDLLDVPALAARFGIAEADLPRIAQWIDGAGVRWGLDKTHRESLGLGSAGEQNAWIFGIRRMLFGYASGVGACYGDIEPYAEVGGLDAALAGALAELIERLLTWRRLLAEPADPVTWGARARLLLKTFFKSSDERDRLTIAQLEQALQAWLENCETAAFDEAVPLAVAREAWLGAIDEASLNQRFVSGGVTFCTLMPMRAVPFRVVCLLGMNDGDYPRRVHRADFDLLSLPGVARPGDRSRRDDDRYLMLEALLAAREKLYISWIGRNARDNSEQPPSVLVSQLRDYLRSGWDISLEHVTTEHPLQPFSRRYFEGGALRTFAREWRSAHDDPHPETECGLPPVQLDPAFKLKLGELARFVRRPVKYFFRHRLQVVFNESELIGQDEEPFGPNRLDEYEIASILLADEGQQESIMEAPECIRQRVARLAREGRLPIGLMGAHWQDYFVQELAPIRIAWLRLCQHYPLASPKALLSLSHGSLLLEDWIEKLRSNGSECVWLEQNPGNVTVKAGKEVEPRGDKMIGAWIQQLAVSAAGIPATGYLVARDAVIVMRPLEPAASQAALSTLMSHWRNGLDCPLPTACKTALQLLAGGKCRDTYDGSYSTRGEVEEPCLNRLWPDFAALSAESGWPDWSQKLYGPLIEWLHNHVTVVAPDALFIEREAA